MKETRALGNLSASPTTQNKDPASITRMKTNAIIVVIAVASPAAIVISGPQSLGLHFFCRCLMSLAVAMA